jgi:hypothetical protein
MSCGKIAIVCCQPYSFQSDNVIHNIFFTVLNRVVKSADNDRAQSGITAPHFPMSYDQTAKNTISNNNTT